MFCFCFGFGFFLVIGDKPVPEYKIINVIQLIIVTDNLQKLKNNVVRAGWSKMYQEVSRMSSVAKILHHLYVIIRLTSKPIPGVYK